MSDVQRDRWGRYLIVNGSGPAKPYTRATTVASTLSDNFGLTNWKMRTLASGLAARDDIYARVAAADLTDTKMLDRLCQDALEAGRSSVGANYGTALHEAIARVNRGEEVTMPAPWAADIDAYKATLAAHGVFIDPQNVEQICVLDQQQIAGTFDSVVALPDGTNTIADLKTGQKLDYSWHEIAIQLAIYAHADAIYQSSTTFRRPMPDVRQDIGLIIHLPAGKNICTLHTVDLTQAWEAAQLAIAVRQWRSRKGLAAAYEHRGPAIAPTGRREHAKRRIEQIRDLGYLDALAERWPAGVPGFKSDHQHTLEEIAAVEQLLNELEKLVGAPF